MTMTITSIVIEIIRTVFFIFYERYFKCKKHKQKHLSNIQQNIFIRKKASKYHSFKQYLQTNMCLSI